MLLSVTPCHRHQISEVPLLKQWYIPWYWCLMWVTKMVVNKNKICTALTFDGVNITLWMALITVLRSIHPSIFSAWFSSLSREAQISHPSHLLIQRIWWNTRLPSKLSSTPIHERDHELLKHFHFGQGGVELKLWYKKTGGKKEIKNTLILGYCNSYGCMHAWMGSLSTVYIGGEQLICYGHTSKLNSIQHYKFVFPIRHC